MSNPGEVWRNKTDEQVRQAVANLSDYTPEGREVILAEAARRGQPKTEAPADKPRANIFAPISSVENRYKDAYRVTSSIVFIGGLVKVAGVVVGIGGSLILLDALPKSSAAKVSVMVVAAVVMFLFWVIGVAIAAQGQILMASLDSAVHSSPFLSDAQRARVMSLDVG